MNLTFKMESVLIGVTTILCATLVLNLLYKLRLALPWRVNCWFCNNNFWVKFVDRNSWFCRKCDQYNGFTKDGDYNKPLNSASNEFALISAKSPKAGHRSPPKNGLCKMCNVNQQLKVAQLANFVPMHESNFDNEIENYKTQLEKAYRLCSPCRKVLQKKLHKEKEVLLGSKVLESRSPEKKNKKQEKRSTIMKGFVNKTSAVIAAVLFLLVSIECYKNTAFNDLPSTIRNIKEILLGLLDRVISIVKMKMILTFPSLENYSFDLNMNSEMLQTNLNLLHIQSLDHANDVAQKVLGCLVCFIQIVGHIWNANKLKHTILTDLLWSVFVMMSVANASLVIEPLYVSIIKLTSILAVLLVYKNMDRRNTHIPARFQPSPRKVKNLQNGSLTSYLDDDSDTLLETDDDVSLSKFGLHNFTDSSHETISPLSASMFNGRSFTPRKCDIMWSKPKLNSTFCVNTILNKSPSSVSENIFIKPSFDTYQNLAKDDSDSDLDESISSLCISSPKKACRKGNSIFSLRKFTAAPSFVAPAPLNRSRPLISPSKLNSTSWVAGGYWGTEGERQIFTVNGSRSSSQSSGFESQASSANQRLAASQPPSREESVCGDSALIDRFHNCGTSSYSSYQSPQSFGRVSSPVFPQMQFNGHVHMPQPQRFAPHPTPLSVYSQQYPNSLFKPPGGSGLIRLPQASFNSH